MEEICRSLTEVLSQNFPGGIRENLARHIFFERIPTLHNINRRTAGGELTV
jgi:hypothetical protein